MSDADFFIQEGAIPAPEGAELAVGSWTCPNDGFTVGPVTGSSYGTMWVECPHCHTAVEIVPLPEIGP